MALLQIGTAGAGCAQLREKPLLENRFNLTQLESDIPCSKKNGAEDVWREGKFICLRGSSDESHAKRFMSLSPKQGDVVFASGPGGEIVPAMKIGDVIWNENLDVVVDDLCVSSCAYFIALGGKRLHLVGNGILGFHGGPIDPDTVDKSVRLTAEGRANLIRENAAFREFFKRRGLDISITFDVPAKLRDKGIDWKSTMWVRKGRELENYGFGGLVECSGTGCQ
jgi:hypothetical protein